MERKCYTCKFWSEQYRDEFRDGYCKRHAPVTLITTVYYDAKKPIFPEMRGGNFCGDWEEFKSNQPEGEAH